MKKIFLDDIRYVPKGFNLVFRTGEELIKYLEENPNEHYELISFDHDLGQNVMDGFDVVKLLIMKKLILLLINFNFTQIT